MPPKSRKPSSSKIPSTRSSDSIISGGRACPPPPAETLPITPEIWLDAERAVWLAAERTLLVADVHFGRAWSARKRGALLPVGMPDDAEDRLCRLQEKYRPDALVFLGDLIHEDVSMERVAAPLRAWLSHLATRSRLVLTLGNHDRALRSTATQLELPLDCVDAYAAGAHWCGHGDRWAPAALEHWKRAGAGWLFMGHEHPSLALGDGVATSVRCPCFLVGERCLILPAFSTWAAGCVVGRRPFLSDFAQRQTWSRAVAAVGARLLPVTMEQGK